MGAVVGVCVTLAKRIDAQPGRAVSQHYCRNAETRDGIGRAGGAGNQIAGFAHHRSFAGRAGHTGAYYQMGLFLKGHGCYHLVERIFAQLWVTLWSTGKYSSRAHCQNRYLFHNRYLNRSGTNSLR